MEVQKIKITKENEFAEKSTFSLLKCGGWTGSSLGFLRPFISSESR